MSESIFSEIPPRTLRLATAPMPSATLHAPSIIAASHDAPLLAILDAPLRDGEPRQVGYRRKEAELRRVFAALAVPDARALHARLDCPRPGDMLAARFAGLIAERRGRLLAFLADARRRAARAGGR
jgi:hypothetical protein